MRILATTLGLVVALLTGEMASAAPTGPRPVAPRRADTGADAGAETVAGRRPAVRSGGPAAASIDGPRSVVVYRPPVTPLIVRRGFDPPRSRYGAGHLGVDLGVGAGGIVRSAGRGVVRFAGQVAGRGVVVIAHPDGISTEYEPVRPLVAVGHLVAAGTPIGVLRGVHRGCAGRCLHWGARRGHTYLDPLGLLHPLGPVRLLPWNRSRGP